MYQTAVLLLSIVARPDEPVRTGVAHLYSSNTIEQLVQVSLPNNEQKTYKVLKTL